MNKIFKKKNIEVINNLIKLKIDDTTVKKSLIFIMKLHFQTMKKMTTNLQLITKETLII